MNRAVEIAGFLAEHGWEEAEHFPFAADFSPRRYARLVRPSGERAVFMDADPNQKTAEFVLIALALKALDFSAPHILAANVDRGLVIMEDLGNKNIGSLIDRGDDPKPYYKRAVDVLLRLHEVFDCRQAYDLDLPLYGGALFASQAELFLDVYVPYAKGREATHDEGEAFRALFKELLRDIDQQPQSLMLRDYMLDNLMDLPERPAWKSIGLLDFQDAGLGPQAYDLASLTEVVRRDGGERFEDELLDYYIASTKPSLVPADLRRMIQTLSLQRHVRILGILARQVREGRQEKKLLMKRVENHLWHLLNDQRFHSLEHWMRLMMGEKR